MVVVLLITFCFGYKSDRVSWSYSSCIRYNREWRYHKEERIWLTRAPGLKLTKAEASFEEGTYFYFDVTGWRKAHKELRVEYEKLEDRPQIPPALSAQMVSSLSVNSWCVFKVIVFGSASTLSMIVHTPAVMRWFSNENVDRDVWGIFTVFSDEMRAVIQVAVEYSI